MHALRRYLFAHRRYAALLVALALCVKLLVPTGYMFAPSGSDSLTLQICNGQGGGAVEIALTRKADSGSKTDAAHHGNEPGHGNEHCGYSALGMSALTGDAPLFLALAIAFILALGFAPVATPALQRRRHATPPLRGPPLTA